MFDQFDDALKRQTSQAKAAVLSLAAAALPRYTQQVRAAAHETGHLTTGLKNLARDHKTAGQAAARTVR